MNKLIGDRGYSAQAGCHYLLDDLPLYHSSRSFVSVDLRLEDQHSHLYQAGQDGETRRGLSVLEKYKARDPQDEQVTYFEFLKRHNNHKPYNLRPQARDRILN
jgi:hypothetical protein